MQLKCNNIDIIAKNYGDMFWLKLSDLCVFTVRAVVCPHTSNLDIFDPKYQVCVGLTDVLCGRVLYTNISYTEHINTRQNNSFVNSNTTPSIDTNVILYECLLYKDTNLPLMF